MGLKGGVGRPSVYPECPSNCGTQDTQTVGFRGELDNQESDMALTTWCVVFLNS